MSGTNRTASCSCFLAFTLALPCLGLAARADESRIGQAVPRFQLPDTQGKIHNLGEAGEPRWTVIAFLGTECPLAKLYGPRLSELAREFGPRGVRFLGINSNVQDAADKVADYTREHDLTFPVLKDQGNVVADQFGATRTPEVFLLDSRRVIRYRGRVDDQYGIGLQKARPGRRDLAVAIEELLAGKSVSVAETTPPGCLIGRVKKSEAAVEVTYAKQISRILEQRCVQCHRKGEVAPFALTSYRSAAGWGEMIREVVQDGRMPPWFADPNYGKFSNDARLTAEEKRFLVQWVDAGCPEGDPKDLPLPRQYYENWNIPKPDLIVKMADKPFQVPAEGAVAYKHFTVDPGFTEDKWVIASEAQPGNRGVVHHILVFLQKPGEKAAAEILRGSLLAGYAPGAPGRMLRPGMARKVPAGSKIIFQMHYTPNGKATEDLSCLGLVFCDAKDVKQEIESGMAINVLFSIPPGAENHRLLSQHRFTEDRYLFNLTPHMHMRGKSFRYEAHYPDGRKEVLLEVPRWDFNWQIEYDMVEPKLMPKGTVLHCTAHYDNSEKNPANPDPKKWVRFGEQTWDEMMIGWFMSASLPRDGR